ncbi:MAG: leucine-rich repeat domain-containing protein [Clostridia bacterium]|nr:leucine-rich repeat domain-containing protein [Clostridia bacterium]
MRRKIFWALFCSLGLLVSLAACSHEHSYTSSVGKEATCTEKGELVYVCDGCEEQYTEEIPAKGHSYAETVILPSCEEGGYTQKVCSVCGDTVIENEMEALGHDYGESVLPATCTEAGVITYTCSRCEQSYTEEIPLVPHTFETKVLLVPNCTTGGLAEHTCTVCGHSEREVLSPAHEFESAVYPPVCDFGGSTKHTCKLCGYYYFSDYVDELGHDYVLVEHVDLTETAIGYDLYRCERCGGSKKDVILPEGEHQFVSETVPSTCTEKGRIVYSCTHCSLVYTEILPLAHEFKAEVYPPVCDFVGSTKHVCKHCGYYYFDSYVDALGHDYVLVERVEPYGITPGKEVYECTRCKSRYTEALAPLPHTWDGGKLVKDSTCSEEGTKLYTCLDCGETYTEAIPKKEHDYKLEVYPPVCDFVGSTKHVCKHCGYYYFSDYIDALGHSYGAWEVAIEATSQSEGEERRTCSRCGAVESRKTPKLAYTEGLVFELSQDGTAYRVERYEGSDTNVVIPATYCGLPVTSIGGFAFPMRNVKSVVIGDNIVKIGESAFEYCSLKSVVLGKKVREIGTDAFLGTKLETIDFRGDLAAWCEIDRLDAKLIIYQSGGSGLIFNGKRLEGELVVPYGVMKIAGYAFSFCSGLTGVSLPETVTSIGYNAFANCSNLKSVNIPDSVINIEQQAFHYCSELTSVKLPSGIKSIEYETFRGCEKLQQVAIPDGVTSIGKGAFRECKALTELIFPKSVAFIGTEAFALCNTVRKVVLENPSVRIEADAFLSDHFEYIDYRGSLADWCAMDHIENNLFLNGYGTLVIGGRKIEGKLTLDGSVTKIGGLSFQRCADLTDVVIGDQVKFIGHGAFKDCPNLQSAVIGGGVETLEERIFEWNNRLSTVVLKEGFRNIADRMFELCENLSSVTIPSTVTRIGLLAFRGCARLTSIELPNGLITLDRYAFQESGLVSVVLPDSLTKIEDIMFCRCYSLTSVTIGANVTSIDHAAFDDCTALKDVYFKGSEEQWNAIAIGTENEPLSRATIHFNAV